MLGMTIPAAGSRNGRGLLAASACVLLCLPLAAAFTATPVTFGRLPAHTAAARASGPLRNVALRSARAAPALSTLEMKVPKIIQGGMGVQVSSWKLAREVCRAGELGVISGTAMETVLIRWLQMGDPDGLYRRALASFPDQGMAQRILDKYFIEGGKADNKPFRNPPMWTLEPNQDLVEATILGNYAEVWLAKHNDDGTPVGGEGAVGINCLTKIQLPTIVNLYGAMIAEVDYVLMGAGIPMEVPGILDKLAEHQDAKLAIDVDDAPETMYTHFSPAKLWERTGTYKIEKPLPRPSFLPIVSSVTLAQAMLKRATGAGPTKGIQGFIIELPTAGGHNAPPRGFRYDAAAKSHKLSLNDKGEPVYGEKDTVDLDKFKSAVKGLPFWLAGFYARPEKLQEVLAVGGAGIQVGTSFAFAKESGLLQSVKEDVLQRVQNGDLTIFTDPVASPTGFPFKVLELEDSLSVKDKYEARPRICNLGYLRTPYMSKEGKLGYRCASEPIDDYLKKEGDLAATEGRKCLCNGLMANAGLPQVYNYKAKGAEENYVEEILITAGDDINQVRQYMKPTEDGRLEYGAIDVINYLLGRFKEEYTAEQNLYSDADKAEDPKVREALLAKKQELAEKIQEVDKQLKTGK